ncbi:hypothetical protein [Streptomyces sp. AC627_RSS907]|uniref:hypothetical protein n=1 Tax=Streptomyces sp. AC627_RSS907 TaxID=2823684 RepID=UPI001C23E497|nr:hypothetical protein [Streptomyces sp. AC627_RSS907]
MADDDGPNNLIHFPRVGYTAPAEPPAEPPASTPADVPFAAPADASLATPEAFAPATRTDPMGVIATLPEPGLGTPFTADSEPAAAPAATPAMVPATFRPEGAQPAAPRLGSLSLAAILAVSLAAMRGIHSAIATGRANREQREAVAKTASTAKDGSLGGGSKKQVQPSHEYGRKTLQRGPGGLGGRSGGSSPGRSGHGGSGPYSGSGGRRGGSTTRSPSGSGGGGGGRGRGPGSGSGGGRTTSPNKDSSGITPLKRTSQGGGVNLKKNRGPGSSGGSGGSGGGKGPNNSGGGSGSSGGGGDTTNRKRGPGSTGSGAGGSSGGPGKKRGPGSGTGTGTGKGTGPGIKSPGKGTEAGGKTTPGTTSSKGTGTGKGTWSGRKSGTKKSPRGTTGPSGVLRKKPGTTTSGTGPKTKPKGKGSSGAGTSAPASKRGGGKKGKTPSGKGGKSRKGKKLKLTPGIAHGTFASSVKQDCRCRKCRRFRKEYSRKVLGAMKSAARGRTTFGEAVHETLEKRLKRRRKKMGPPVVTKVKVKKPKKKTGPKTKTTKPSGTTPAGSAAKAPTGPAAKAPTRRTPWSTAKARARKRARMRTTTVPGPRPAPTTGTTTPAPPPGPPGPAAAAPAPAAAVAGAATAPAPPGGGTVPGTDTGTPRLSPFEAMGMATAVSAPAGPITVERADSPGSGPAMSGGGLPDGISSTSTKEHSVSDAWLTKWGSGSVADMDAQHETEVTLDDTLDVLEELTEQSFKAHETCNKLSAKARQIRHELDELAADLRSTHNVIGRMTGAAMAKLAESMELLARKADEMSTKSLTAAELSESAENAMFDAYRPLQQATEDAGLAVPAARIHNEN